MHVSFLALAALTVAHIRRNKNSWVFPDPKTLPLAPVFQLSPLNGRGILKRAFFRLSSHLTARPFFTEKGTPFQSLSVALRDRRVVAGPCPPKRHHVCVFPPFFAVCWRVAILRRKFTPFLLHHFFSVLSLPGQVRRTFFPDDVLLSLHYKPVPRTSLFEFREFMRVR